MHWVMCTSPEGKKMPVNLTLIACMMAIKEDKEGGRWFSRVFLAGNLTTLHAPDGSSSTVYAHLDVMETPQQILNLPQVTLGPLRITGPSPAEGVPSKALIEQMATQAKSLPGSHRGRPHPKDGKPDAKIGPNGRRK